METQGVGGEGGGSTWTCLILGDVSPSIILTRKKNDCLKVKKNIRLNLKPVPGIQIVASVRSPWSRLRLQQQNISPSPPKKLVQGRAPETKLN